MVKFNCWVPGSIKLQLVLFGDYTIEKNAIPLTYTTVGEIINYTVTVTNVGNTNLYDIPLDDPFLGYNDTIPSLPKETSQTINIGTHIVTQADIDNGSITNTITSNDESSSITVNLIALDFIKSTTTQSYSTVGEIIRYTYNITNTGNVTLNSLNLVDDKATINPIAIVSLSPGASAEFFINYTVTQADLDAGSITNIATISNDLITITRSLTINEQL